MSGAAFQFCSSLENIEIPEGNIEIGQGRMKKYEYMFPDGSVQTKEILEDTGYVFASCTGLGSMFLSENVEDIVPYAFCGCRSLEDVFVDDNNVYRC